MDGVKAGARASELPARGDQGYPPEVKERRKKRGRVLVRPVSIGRGLPVGATRSRNVHRMVTRRGALNRSENPAAEANGIPRVVHREDDLETDRERKPRLLLVATFLSAEGGSRAVMEELATRLKIRGWPLVTTSRRIGGLARGWDMLTTAILRRTSYDVAVVDLFSGRAFLWGEAVGWTAYALGKPVVFTLRGGDLPGYAARARRRVRALLRRAAAVTVPSRYLFDAMREFRDDLELLENPLDLSLYAFRVRRPATPKLVWLRAFHHIYNPALAPRVVQRLVDEFPDISLVMVGRDKHDGSFEETRRIAAKLGVADRIRLPGGVPKKDVASWLNKGDIFLNTTNIDNAPVSVLEAMACGLCVVSTSAGGMAHLVEDEREALLVQPDDPDAMADAVRRVITEPDLAERLSRSGRERVARCDWSILLPRWEALIRGAAKGAA
jgi:glycosyltransferase involved in cell wall biosynthesis